MGKEAITKKIRGEFLRIEKQDGRFRVEYVNGSGYLCKRIMWENDIYHHAKKAENNIKEFERELSKTTNEKLIRALKSRIQWELMSVLWPQMYIAYYKGEDLNRFFESPVPTSKIETQRKKSPMTEATNEHIRHLYKYEIVKSGVDRLHAEKRLKDSLYTKEQTIRDYADQTNDSFENVNKAYYYKPKK